MENTLENKARFIALYWGQNLRIIDDKNEVHNYTIDEITFKYIKTIELKPISSISDEDAKKLGFRCSEHFKSDANESGWKDELRYLGYAVEWDGLTVEEQIEFGWVKLKTE